MKKITILALHLNYGGIEKCICTLANMLITNYEVEIVCNYKLNSKPVFPINDKVVIKYLTTKYIPTPEKWKNSLKKFKLITFIKETIHNVLVLYYRKKNMKEYIKYSNSNVIISTRDIHNKWLGKYGKKSTLKIGWEHNHPRVQNYKKIAKTTKKLDYFVLLTKTIQKFYQKYTNTKCICISNSIKLNHKLSSLNQKRLISVGRLSPEKGYDDLIEMFNKLLEKDSKWALDIIGDGNLYDQLKLQIETNNLANKITLHGYKDAKYINEYLKKSMIYIMTSHTETFPLVILEAMNYGLPCISFDTADGACELIKNNYNGFIIKNRSQEKMVDKILELSNNKLLRDNFGKNGHEIVKKYDYDIIKKQWINLIEGAKK